MELLIHDLGRLRYADAYAMQNAMHAAVLDGTQPSTVLMVEHPSVITLGASFHEHNLLTSPEGLRDRGIELERTDRGGDVTYHGPGQLVAYPIVRLDEIGRDLHAYLRRLDAAVIEVCAAFELTGERNPVNTGVWIANRKVCAIGIKVRRWVTLHGLALNCNTDLSAYRHIVPCGIRGNFGVTSLSKELNRDVPIEEVRPVLVECLARQFGATITVGETVS